jgi:putative ABC transport system substrate-binding protein
MRRREFIALLGATTLAADLANSQTSSKVYQVGLLGGGPPLADDSEAGAAFLRGMRQAGYELGRNLALERRGAMGRLDRLPALLQELIAAKVDVIVTNGFPPPLRFMAAPATTATPPFASRQRGWRGPLCP